MVKELYEYKFEVPKESIRYKLKMMENNKKKSNVVDKKNNCKKVLTLSMLIFPKDSIFHMKKVDLENIIINAIKKALIDPLINFISTTWDIIISISPIVGSVVAIISYSFYLAGYEKGKKITVISFLVVFLLLVLNTYFQAISS